MSRICAELDRDLDAFRNRRIDHVEFPYVFADATYVKGRVNGRVVSRAAVIATGVTDSGDREVLGVEVGDSESGAFWASLVVADWGGPVRAGDPLPTQAINRGVRVEAIAALLGHRSMR